MLKTKNDPEKVGKMATIIKRSTDRALQLLDDLLARARSQNGKPLELVSTTVAEQYQIVYDLLQSQAQEKGVVFHQSCSV